MDYSVFNFIILVTAAFLLAGTAGLFAHKGGNRNYSYEGTMIFGGMIFIAFAQIFPNSWMPVLLAGIAAMGWQLLYSIITVNYGSDQVVVATVLNIIVMTFSLIIIISLNGNTGYTTDPNIYQWAGTPKESFNLSFLFYLGFAVAAFIGVWWFYKKTRIGKWVTACGENPDALEAQGVSPVKVKHYVNLTFGFLVGVAGAMLMGMFAYSAPTHGFKGTLLGIGYISIAVLMMSGYKWWAIPVAASILGLAMGFAFEFLVTNPFDSSVYLFLSLSYLIPLFAMMFIRLSTTSDWTTLKFIRSSMLWLEEKQEIMSQNMLSSVVWFIPWMIALVGFWSLFIWPWLVASMIGKRKIFMLYVMTERGEYVVNEQPQALGANVKKFPK